MKGKRSLPKLRSGSDGQTKIACYILYVYCVLPSDEGEIKYLMYLHQCKVSLF